MSCLSKLLKNVHFLNWIFSDLGEKENVTNKYYTHDEPEVVDPEIPTGKGMHSMDLNRPLFRWLRDTRLNVCKMNSVRDLISRYAHFRAHLYGCLRLVRFRTMSHTIFLWSILKGKYIEIKKIKRHFSSNIFFTCELKIFIFGQLSLLKPSKKRF